MSARTAKPSVKSPTSTRTEVRSPTRTATSTKAHTSDNITVTGGAGRGATTTVTILKPKSKRNPRQTNAARVGQTCTVRGLKCRVIAVEPAGTVVVETLDGSRHFRVSGLSLGQPKRKPNGFFDADARARAKPVTRIRRIIERDTKEPGEILSAHPGGWLKVQWDNREKPTLIKRSEIKRYKNLRVNPANPGLMELAGGVQALEYLAGKAGLGGKRKQRNPVNSESAYSKAASLRFPYIRGEGKLARNGRTWLSRFTKTADGDGAAVFVGWDDEKRKWIIEKTKGKRNPTAQEMSERFQGRASGQSSSYYFSDKAPPRLEFSRGGKFVFLKLKGTTVRVAQAVVAIDPVTERLWLGCKSATGMFKRKAKPGEDPLNYGFVDVICYLTAKKHIGSGKRFEYVHNFGEDGGRKPTLLIDYDGMPILKGGSYKIEARGIVN